MATTIQEFVKERGINCLMHFTRMQNLGSILERGLVTRDTLILEGFSDFNDQIRLDETHAVCGSIGFPNYKMFYRLRCENPKERWVVIVLHETILWELNCAFCCRNAASKHMTTTPWENKLGLSALQAMFIDQPHGERQAGLSKDFTTDPQAEVLMLDGVPREYIWGVVTESIADKNQVEAKYPGLEVYHQPEYFSGRPDHVYWKGR